MFRVITAVGLVAIILVAVAVTVISLVQPAPERIVTMPYTFSVKDNVGMVVDNDKLHFGGGRPGMVMKRNIIIAAPFDSTVVITTEGPGRVVVSENNFELEENSPYELTFSMTVPDDLPLGQYEGIVFISFFPK